LLIRASLKAGGAEATQIKEDTGQAICAFVTVRGGTDHGDALEDGIRSTVAERIGKFARPKRVRRRSPRSRPATPSSTACR
jgi:acyl-coenzyme A synthetase/AMP-(fatty) acid ligase